MTPLTILAADAAQALQGVTKLAADCELAAKVMAETGTFETGQAILKEAAAALTALSAENVALKAKIAEYEAHDGMHGAIVHAIRSLLSESNVPGAAFIDDHVANAIVQRDALAAQVAELTADRDVSNACNRGLVRLNEATQARAEAAEAKAARLEGKIADALGRYQVTHIHAALTEGDTNE